MTLGGMEDQLGVTWCEVNSLTGSQCCRVILGSKGLGSTGTDAIPGNFIGVSKLWVQLAKMYSF